jgi:hypothetical protein
MKCHLECFTKRQMISGEVLPMENEKCLDQKIKKTIENKMPQAVASSIC